MQMKNKKVTVLVLLALFAALSIVLGKFLQIPIGDSIRISFENTTLLISGMLFGPWAGAITGIVADLLGSVLKGYSINPVITLGAASIGLISGFMFRLTARKATYVNMLLCVMTSHIIGSVVIKSLGLYLWYSTPLTVLAIRLPVYICIGALESYIICLLFKKGVFSRYLL
ncbi:MAG TPA: folate family ECF transporter S component [Bacillota bacterium]|nr:folate family ECF transporter S component [Bacillota bacterium]